VPHLVVFDARRAKDRTRELSCSFHESVGRRNVKWCRFADRRNRRGASDREIDCMTAMPMESFFSVVTLPAASSL